MNCICCGSEWLYIAKTHHLWCLECYSIAREIVKEYHSVQDEAKEKISIGKIEEGIVLLKTVIQLRNKLANSFKKGLNSSHDYFAYLFLPNLIDKLKKSK
jgi:protein-arginine kinase activator protein McsA